MLSCSSNIMYDDDIDLEDLECRLYSQVYHSNATNEEANLPSEADLTPVNDKPQSSRYFSKGYPTSNRPAFVPLEGRNETNSDNPYPLFYNNISFDPTLTNITTEGNFGNQFQNNITVNQYTVPVIINTNLNEVLDPNDLWVAQSVTGKKKKPSRAEKRALYRRKKNRERKNKRALKTIIREALKNSDDIVNISDDSDSECIIVKDMSNKTPKPSEEPRPSVVEVENTDPESDDDIIYVPPPPVVVINVDVDTEEKDDGNVREASDPTELPTEASCQQTCSNALLITSESCASNDFLDNSGIENNSSNFNFSLHGSDFNNTGDFLRPPNPVEYCETESSCSTNENRENNSVKTIVFNEVDFPREDIFSDKNLEGFSSYITPKRSANKTLSENESSSSSESDYEPPNIVNRHVKGGELESKKLPTLSPMQDDKVAASSSKKKLYCTPQKKSSGKRKSDTLSHTESDCNSNENSKLRKKLPKKKKKSNGKKRNPLAKPDITIQVQNKDINEECVAPTEDTNVEDNNTVHESIDDTNTNMNTSKKKKRNCKKREVDSEKIKRKKRKSVSPEDVNDSSPAELNRSSLGATNVDNAKTGTECLADNDNSIDSLEEVHDEVPIPEPTVDKAKRKKKKSTSENAVNDAGNSEINQPQNPRDKDNVNESSNVKDGSTPGGKQDTSGIDERHAETRNNKAPTDIIDNEHDVIEVLPRYEVYNIEGDISDENENDEDIIVVGETGPENDPEIVVSSDSEYDFNDLGNVGQDIELANCSVKYNTRTSEGVINVEDNNDDFTGDVYLRDNNLCGNYSKFDVEQIQNTQSDNPDSWKISRLDQLMFLNCNKKRGPRCTRCRQFGHIAVRCLDKPHPPKCTLCGFPDHEEPRCPNKMCNQCGNKGDYSTTYCWKCIKFRNSVCRLCNMKGHIAKSCPDLWRRYHLTTQEGPIIVPNGPQLKPRDQLWCSGCSRQGHLEHECNYCIREYPPTNPCIASYEDVLYQQNRNEHQNAPIPPPPPVIRQTPPVIRHQPPIIRHPPPVIRHTPPVIRHTPSVIGPPPPVFEPPPPVFEPRSPVFEPRPPVFEPRPSVFEPPPPVINAPQQSNFFMPPLSNVSSTSQNVPFRPPIFIPPLMSQLMNPVFPHPSLLNQNQMMVPNSSVNDEPNLTPAPTKVLNPFSILKQQDEHNAKHEILDQMLSKYVKDGNDINYLGSYRTEKGTVIPPAMVRHGVNELLKRDQRRVRGIILTMPAHVVHQFISKEMADLENVVSRCDPRYLKKKLFKYDKMSETTKKALKSEFVKEKCFWYRILNMFIFGVHHMKDGKFHFIYIKRYLLQPKPNKLDAIKRKSLLNAYNYIFDGTRHVNINYYKVLQQIIQKKIDGNK